MTTPVDNTPESVIIDAYTDAGLLQQGDSLDGEQLAAGMRKLSDLILLWQTQGLKLWLNVDTSVPLVAGQAAYTLAPAGNVAMDRPLRVIEAYHLASGGVTRRPVTILDWSAFLGLQAATGTIHSIHVDKGATAFTITCRDAPDATDAAGTLHLLLQTQATRSTKLNDVISFPPEWRIALRWGLADELCTGQPQALMDRCQQRAMAYRTALEDWDTEDAPIRFAAGR